MDEGKEMLIHVIEAEDVIRELPGSSRLNNRGTFSLTFTKWAANGPTSGWQINFADRLQSRPSISRKNIFDRHLSLTLCAAAVFRSISSTTPVSSAANCCLNFRSPAFSEDEIMPKK